MLELIQIIDLYLYNLIIETLSQENTGATVININLFNHMSMTPVLDTCNAFLDCITQLITRFWNKNWKSGNYSSHFIGPLLYKFTTVLDLKTIEQQALLLLSKEDGLIFKQNNYLTSLNKSNILSNETSKFNKIVNKFDHAIQPFLYEILAHIRNALDFNSKDIGE